jgi:hypothetical protein
MTMFKPADGGRRAEAGDRRTDDGGRLDLAINRAVREMLDVEPPAGLRGRVLQRISDSDRQVASGFSRRLLWGAIPLGAAAAVLLAVLLPRIGSEPAPPPLSTVATARPVAAIEAPHVAPLPRGVAPVAARTSAAEGIRRLTVEGSVTAASFEPVPGGVDIEPLATIEPIRIAAVTPAAIAHQEVVVSPLAPIAQLRIAPLSPPDGRD